MSVQPETSQPTIHPHLTEILVNEHKVMIAGPKATGLAIKQAAIDAGVRIQLDFVLSEEHPNGRSTPVPDDVEVTVHPGARFTALPHDDNS